MKILLLGSGGREHALAWKLSQSDTVGEIVAMPGSDAIDALPKVRCVRGDASNVKAVIDVAYDVKPDLVVVGPEDPLAKGVTDALEEDEFLVFGPSKVAAQLESSKIFAKEFMREQGIPTAGFISCDNYEEAKEALADWKVEEQGVVIKADALAGGKGVVVTHDRKEAENIIADFMIDPDCTVKTERILLEKKLVGREVSAFAICDGNDFLTLGYACDYKRVGDGDVGANTGGMGGYAPIDWPGKEMKTFIEEKIFEKVVEGMADRDTPFKGILFVGLMVEGEGYDNVKVIEFNVRLGDPEAQILLPLVEDDMAEVFLQAAKGKLYKLNRHRLKLRQGTAVHVVMASEGYPSIDGSKMTLGEAISLPDNALNASNADRNLVFMAGAKCENGVWVNSGGRVLGVTSLADNIEQARNDAYEMLSRITFKGAHWRRDIGS